MKKVIITIAGFAFLTLSSVSIASSFECWRYKNSKPQGYVNVKADSKPAAERKAAKKFRDMSKPMDYVKCHYS